MASTDFLYLGAQDWRHPEWRGGFYPDDLPDDWLLSYYNSYFQSVYLTLEQAAAATPADWETWLADTLERFVFLVEFDTGLALPASPKIRRVQPDWAVSHVCWLDAALDLRALSRRIATHAATGQALFILSRAADLTALHRVGELRQVMGY
ncbi:MAG: hypothetical protein LDL16_00475 [Thiobacillus sp.]|nr:hypothetical protein [Thiobacillus sp.]